MELLKVDISAEDFRKLNDDEQIFFVQISSLLNEVSILQKCVVFSSQGIADLETQIERSVQVYQSLFFFKMLSGKLYEGWTIIIKKSFLRKPFSKEYHELLCPKAKSSLERLKKYFRKENLIKTIRNRFAFHYNREYIEQKIHDIFQGPGEHRVLEIYISKYRGDCQYAAADEITTRALLETVSAKPEKAMEQFIDEIMQVSTWFQDFGGDCVRIALERMNVEGEKLEEVEIADPPFLLEVVLPYFVQRQDKDKRS